MVPADHSELLVPGGTWLFVLTYHHDYIHPCDVLYETTTRDDLGVAIVNKLA